MSYARPVQRSTRQFDIAAAVGQTVFSFPAPLFDTADVLVLVNVGLAGFAPPLGPYTVTLTPGLTQGTITFDTTPCPAAGVAVTVRLKGLRVQSRTTDVTRGGSVSAVALEAFLDQETVVLQELRRDVSACLALLLSLPVDPVTGQPIAIAAVLQALLDLPSTLPTVPGALWWNGGVLCRS